MKIFKLFVKLAKLQEVDASNALIKKRIRVIEHLGSGDYFQVFKINYKGKICAAKITDDYEHFKIFKNLKNIKDSFGEGKEHLPEIYNLIETVDEGNNIYIAIVEILEPLKLDLAELLFRQTPFSQIRKKDSFIKESLYIKIIEKAIEMILKNKNLNNLNIEEFKFDIIKIYKDNLYLLNKFENSGRFISEFENQAKIIIREKYLKNERLFKLILEKNGLILRKFLLEGFSEQIFPRNYDEEELITLSENLPESKSLIKTLTKLKVKYGFSWKDMHENNLMMRPETNEIVIADPGLFDIE